MDLRCILIMITNDNQLIKYDDSDGDLNDNDERVVGKLEQSNFINQKTINQHTLLITITVTNSNTTLLMNTNITRKMRLIKIKHTMS